MYNPSEERFKARMEVHTWEQREERKRFDEYERRKERAADPLVPMITDEDGEDELEWARR